MKSATASNVVDPAAAILRSLGYEVSARSGIGAQQQWRAKLNDTTLVASSAVELLGLVKLIECREQGMLDTDQA